MATVMGGSTGYQDDRELLIRFLLDARKVLMLFFDLSSLLLPRYLQNEFTGAWEDVDIALEDSVLILQGNDPRQSRRPVPSGLQVDQDELDKRLEFFGLTGRQLRLKLTSFYNTYSQTLGEPTFVQTMTMTPSNTAQRETKKKQSKLMEWLLEKLNSIFGSLARVIPSVDIIKEFKEMAEYGYKESQQDFLR